MIEKKTKIVDFGYDLPIQTKPQRGFAEGPSVVVEQLFNASYNSSKDGDELQLYLIILDVKIEYFSQLFSDVSC